MSECEEVGPSPLNLPLIANMKFLEVNQRADVWQRVDPAVSKCEDENEKLRTDSIFATSSGTVFESISIAI